MMILKKHPWIWVLLLATALAGCRVEWVGEENVLKDLVVIQTSPGNRQTNVSQTADIVIRTSVPLDPEYVIPNTAEPWKMSQVILVDQTNTVLPVQYSFNGEYLTLIPNSPFAPQSTYGVAVRPGARDVYGNNIKTPYAFTFSTGTTLTAIPNWPPFTLPPTGGGAGAIPGTFTLTGQLNIGRDLHELVRLDDGRILLTGGERWKPYIYTFPTVAPSPPNPEILRSAEVYDPATGMWSLSVSNQSNGMFFQRVRHAMVKLLNGHVLVTGGWDTTSIWDSVEEYDPRLDRFSLLQNPLLRPRYWHTCVLMANGNPIVIGGASPSGILNRMEVLDLQTGTWIQTQSPMGGLVNSTAIMGRYSHRSVSLPDRSILTCGGYAAMTDDTAELYWPSATGNGTMGVASFTGSNMSCGRDGHTATLLSTGYGQGVVVVIGGQRDDYVFQPITINTAEVYDHSLHATVAAWNGTQGVWTPVGSAMFSKRVNHTATLLQNGKILVTGGWLAASVNGAPHGAQSRTCEIFDPFSMGYNITAPFAGIDLTGKFDWTRDPQGNITTLPNLFTGTAWHAATILNDGRVLITGGLDLRPRGNPPGWAGFPFAPPTGWPDHPVSTTVCWIYNP